MGFGLRGLRGEKLPFQRSSRRNDSRSGRADMMRPFVDSVAYVVGIMDDIPNGLLIALDPKADMVIGNVAAWGLFGLHSGRRSSNRVPSFRTPIGHVEILPEALPLQRAMRENRPIL